MDMYPASGTPAARVTDYPTGRLARRPPRTSSPPWRARALFVEGHRGGGPRGRSLPRPLRCGWCEGRIPGLPQLRLRFGSEEELSTVDSAAPTYANGRLAPRRSQDRRGDGVSTKFVNPLRRKRSGLTGDNSFRQGPRCGRFPCRLKRRRRTSTTPPSRAGWKEIWRLPRRRCVAWSLLRTRTSSNRGRSHAKEVCRSPRRWGSNVLPGRSRQGEWSWNGKLSPPDGPSGRLRTRTKE